MFYVYILKSNSNGEHFYVGSTTDFRRRINEHHRGDATHTARYRPWRLINYFAFTNSVKAQKFEKYLKTCSGRKFQIRHFGE